MSDSKTSAADRVPKKGDRVRVYSDPHTRKEPIGEGTIGSFITRVKTWSTPDPTGESSPAYLAAVRLDGDDLNSGTSFTFQVCDLIPQKQGLKTPQKKK